MKKWVKWSLIGTAAAAVAVTLLWAILLCFQFNIFAPKGWQDGKYLDNMGKPLSGWQTIDGKTYYLDPVKVTGWLDTQEGRYYLDAQGNPKTGWHTDESGTYLLTPEGKALTGWVQTDRGDRYFSPEGVMAMGTQELYGRYWYFGQDGTPHNGWFENRYYKAGEALTGWQDLEEGRCYFYADGLAAQGWQTISNRKYLFTDGVACVGWYTEGSARYYFHEDGHMAVGRTELGGETRFFSSTGKYVVLVNFEHPVPEDYVPDLVPVEGRLVDASIVEDLQRLLAAARAAGHPVYINNAYRSVETQQYMFNKRLNSYMEGGMDAESATALITQSLMLPGHSEHHLGLAMDVRCANKTYKWLEENGWQYGFILRYPEGKTNITGIIYEPWHFRYVGPELAKELYESGLCLEEYMSSISLSTYDGQGEEF